MPGWTARAGSAARVARGAVAVGLAAALAGGLPLRAVSAWRTDRARRSVLVASRPRVRAVGAESQYANVIAQVGGRYVAVSAIMRNPNTDPHSFEASPSVARAVAGAQLVVQNGLGYDTFMQTIEDALPSSAREVIVVQRLLHLPARTPNPHLWYAPRTMPLVARAVARDLSTLDPAHRAYFWRNAARFDASLGTWRHAIAELRSRFAGAPVATTEPVADDLLQAAGLDDKTPFGFQRDVMNGVDPSPQDVADVEQLLRARKVRVLVYNRQVTDTLTQSLLGIAKQARVPVVGVYETMPEPGFDYQRWMTAEVRALEEALATGTSSPEL